MTRATTPRQHAHGAALAASAVIRVAILDGAVTWAPCLCGCGVVSVHVVGLRGWRAFAGVSRIVGEA